MKTAVDQKDRFQFGENWANFLTTLDDARINEAVNSLRKYLSLDSPTANLKGKTFLDIGCGSGLFSLAAYKLGATVHSFDYDKNSVKCATYLREKFAGNDPKWVIEQGSVLDGNFMKKIAPADIVYSWGVLHHTGDMYTAFDNAAKLVSEKGTFFISIYNDQGSESKRWTWIKKNYVHGNSLTRAILIFYTFLRQWGPTFVSTLLKGKNPLHPWTHYKNNNRGMSAWHDLIDWVGGYPFEVAKPEDVFDFFTARGFRLEKLKTCAGGLGCNEYVFTRTK